MADTLPIVITVEIELQDFELRMLEAYVEACKCSIPQAVADLMICGLTLGLEEQHRQNVEGANFVLTPSPTGCLTLENPAADDAPQR